MRVSFSEAKRFLERINKKDEIAIFTHNDLDGIASGILFYDFCKKKNCKKIDVFLIDYGKDKLLNFDINKKTKILISDLVSELVFSFLKRIPSKIQVFYTDHHQSEKEIKNKNIFEFRTTNKGYIPSSRTVYELVGGKKWIAVLGVLADGGEKYKENKKFLKELTADRSIAYFRKKMVLVSRAVVYFKDKEKKLFNVIKKIESLEKLTCLKKYSERVKKEIEFFAREFEKKVEKKNKINFFYFKPKYEIKSLLVNYVSCKKKKEIYIFLIPHKNKVNISARNQSRKYNLYKILKDGVINLKYAEAGGHLSAAGATIKKRDLGEFKKRIFSINLNDYLIKNG